MPVLRNIWDYHRPIVITIGVLCVCIVTTAGFVRGAKGHIHHRFGGHNEVGVMGHNIVSDPLGSHDDEAPVVGAGASDMLHSYHYTHQFSESSSDKSLEERLLAQGHHNAPHAFQREEEMLTDPHPHISIPQLPFCKPTRSTVGGSTSGSGLKPTSEESINPGQSSGTGDGVYSHDKNQHDYDDIEIVRTEDGVLESDRKFLVATLDGKVTLLNRTGHQLWTVKTGPLFSSTISSLQLNENGKWINLIPSLTGGVYKYDGDSLYPMPFNADSLLKKSFKLSHDVVITGGKELRTFGIDVNTGDIRYECGIAGCVSPSDLNANGKSGQDPVVLVVKKQLQTVRAIDSANGVERWNFSVGTHELALAGVTEGCYHGEQRDPRGKTTDFLKVVIPEGRVFGADRENHVVWDHKFESPISQAWILENGQLISVDPITNTPLADVPSLYIGIHNQQFYVQESQRTAEKMERYFGIESLASEMLNRRPLNLAWRSPAAIEGVSGSTALSTINPTPNWVSFAPTPNFRPIFIYDRDYVGDSNFEGPNITTELPLDEMDEDDNDRKSTDEFDEPELDFSEGITQVIVMSLWFWWKEILGISLFTAVLLNLILMKPIMRAVRRLTIREMSVKFQQLWAQWKEEEESRALLARHSTNLPSILESSPEDKDELISTQEMERRKRSTSCSSSGSATAADDREIYFTSQYLNEFIPIACLGRGGFGVVFEAKKKIDDRTYAVKRITLPDREKARVRVMREVKALAQLDHRNIVRYFNAWIESPPPGWLEKNDPLWAKTLIGSTSPTMDYPSDMFASSMLPLESPRPRPDHSKISVPATPASECPEGDEDSYIVFEASTGETEASSSVGTNSTLLSRSRRTTLLAEELDENATSIQIPTSKDTSVASSSASSVSGGGFFARRPTSLNIQSSISSFHDEEGEDNKVAEISQRGLLASVANDEEFDEEGKKSPIKEDEEVIAQDIMYLYIQQELCQKRTLQDWLRAEKTREIGPVIKIFAQIVEAVEYVHSKKLIHRDLKPSNIFLADSQENGQGVLTVKVGDFGLATTAYAELESEKQTTPLEDKQGGGGGSATVAGLTGNMAVRINLTGHVGTHLYMSPEQKPYDYKVDIYSLGLIFFELLVPFSTDMERYHTLSGVRKLHFPAHFMGSYPTEYDLIRTMISHNPNERPDATKITIWVKNHMENLPDPNATARGRGSGDAFVERSISSPAKLKQVSDETSKNNSDKKKLKHRYYKTKSVA